MDRTELADKLLTTYANWYDIVRLPETEAPMFATADFHEHGVGYMFTKSAQMWTADRHEYAYFFSVPELTEEIYDACFKKAYALGEAKVDPDKGSHMSTNIVMFFLADKVSEAAALKLQKCKVRKNFQFALKGWMEVHTAAVVLETESVIANAAGRNDKAFLEKTLHPPKRKPGLMGKLFGR